VHGQGGDTSAAVKRAVAVIREQHLPNVELVTHDGRAVRFSDDLVPGKVVNEAPVRGGRGEHAAR